MSFYSLSLIASKIGTNQEEKCCVSGTNGCEIQAILDSAEYCSENGVYFNLTKYTSFVEEMIDFGKTKSILHYAVRYHVPTKFTNKLPCKLKTMC